jgi:uncharacterized protein
MNIDESPRPEPLGVGLLFNPALPEILERRPDAVDFLSVAPDVLQIDQGRGRRVLPAAFGRGRFADVEALTDVVEALARAWPVVAHGVGLSIGSPGPLDAAYLRRMCAWTERLRLRWFGEHLSFFRLPRGATAAHEAGLAAPLPLDFPVLRAVARKAARVRAALGVPFLLENGVAYVRPVDDDLEEWEFLNRLAAHRSAGVLLDLHNLYVNARNHGFDADEYLDRLDMRNVVEIHLAGGDELGGMYTDAHSGAVPEAVWSLLDRALPRATRLRGVTFEFHESCLPRLGVDGVVEQLTRAREHLARAEHPAARPAAATVGPRPTN